MPYILVGQPIPNPNDYLNIEDLIFAEDISAGTGKILVLIERERH